MQDRDLSEYRPSLSNTSKNLPCSHHLCKQNTNCEGPDEKEPCSYIAEYNSENTSSSGFLVEDKLHLASVSDNATQNHVQASVILGCVYIVCLPLFLLLLLFLLLFSFGLVYIADFLLMLKLVIFPLQFYHSRCGRKQSGGYLTGAAPDGVMGLGPGDLSVPSLLAKAGLVRNSFSICFDENDSGRILFGDEGDATQKSTPFLPIVGK